MRYQLRTLQHTHTYVGKCLFFVTLNESSRTLCFHSTTLCRQHCAFKQTLVCLGFLNDISFLDVFQILLLGYVGGKSCIGIYGAVFSTTDNAKFYSWWFFTF